MQPRGQVTVELMLIMAVLLVILLVSVNIFGTQANSANSKQALLELRQNQEKVMDIIYQVSNSPVGTTVVSFVPVSLSDQNFFIVGKNLYGSSAEYDLITVLPFSGIDSNSFTSGMFIRAARTTRGISIGPAEIAVSEAPGDGGGKGDGDGDDGGDDRG